ncbi:MAG: nucleoside monophosphate kinase [Lentisphaerae bacterium]|nr:nucleoside monophosphate kinase [Lentisphaerota bacterium]
MPDALLLLGPTGCGKTPLGDALQREGFGGRRCHHFDFGAQLRKASGGGAGVALDVADMAFVRDVLETGVLLENETFRIAERIWEGFLAERDVRPDDLIVLNGLPRHVDQARDVDRLADVGLVVELACSAGVVRRRIRRNAGGDRAGRADDDPAAVERKLRLYEERTLPLVEHYRVRGAEIRTIPIAMDTDPCAILRALSKHAPLPGEDA